MRKLLQITAKVTRLYAALALLTGVLLGAGLSGIVAEPNGHPFVEIASAAPSFDVAEGEMLFAANCATCHQASGEGIPGVFPPLRGDGVVLATDPTRHIRVLLEGIQRANVGGIIYSSPMPPFGITLSDKQVADIIDYERTSWGNHAPLVTSREVAAVRATLKH